MIALVISIIVMLILAGVSINAIVGDDGIISKAQSATYLQSIAELQEFLQMEYSNYALEDNPYGTAYGLLKAKHPGWFYQNAQGYILDSEGHVLYLIKKSGLPEEIQKQVKGGDASKVSQYYKQKDVYGVTSDLQVYYCANGTSTIMGLTTEDLDKDNPLEIAYDEDSLLSKVVNGVGEDGKATEALSTQDLKSIKTLTIDTTEKLALLQEFKKLPSLQTVYFANITIPTLEGMQYANNITEVRFTSCAVQDYSALCGLSKLNKLYLIAPVGKNTDVATLCSSDKGIATAEFSNLKYFGIVGDGRYIQSTSTNYSDTRYDITDISGLANLSTTTKQAIQYMYLQNLQLTSIASIADYINITILRLEENALTTFNGIQNMSKLAYLIAPTCYSNTTSTYTIGKEETDTQNASTDALSYIYKNEEGKNTSLYHLDIRNAQNLKWTSYLSSCSGIRYLYMDNNTAIKDVSTIASTIGNCGSNYSIPPTMTVSIISNNSYKLDLSNATIKKQEFEKLKNNKNLQYLNLSKTNILNNDGSEMNNLEYTAMFNDILSECDNMLHLQLRGQSKLNNINFVEKMIKLRELVLFDCSNVNDISILEQRRLVSGATELGFLVINNPNLELKNIQKTISALGGYSTYWLDARGATGLWCSNSALLSKLSDCTELTALNIRRSWYDSSGLLGGISSGYSVDLTKCKKINSINLYRAPMSFKLPSSVTNFSIGYKSIQQDLTQCQNLSRIAVTDSMSYASISSMINSLPEEFSTLTYFSINTKDTTFTDFNFLERLKNCKGLSSFTFTEQNDFLGLKILDISGLNYLKYATTINFILAWNNPSYIPNLPDFSSNLNLKNFTIKYGNVQDLSNIQNYNSITSLTIVGENIRNTNNFVNLNQLQALDLSNDNINDLTGLANLVNLASLNLSGNRVNNVKPLENLKKLETLNLQNNALYDSSYDSTGKPYYTLTVFADLNQKQDGKLKKLYLSGNNIEDFSMLQDSNLKWDAKSGW